MAFGASALMPTSLKAQSSEPPVREQEPQEPQDGFFETTRDVFLTTAVSSAPMVMSAAFGLPGVVAGTASHAGVNYLAGIDPTRGLKNSVPMMLGAAATSAIFGRTAGLVGSVACGLGMALTSHVFRK